MLSNILYQLILAIVSTGSILLVAYAVFDVRLDLNGWLPLYVVLEVFAFVGIGARHSPHRQRGGECSRGGKRLSLPDDVPLRNVFPSRDDAGISAESREGIAFVLRERRASGIHDFLGQYGRTSLRGNHLRSGCGGVCRGGLRDSMGSGRLNMPKRILFICGSMNQTTQMHQIAAHLGQYEQAFTPYYCDGLDEVFRRMGWMEFTIIGNKLASRCRKYLEEQGLAIVSQGRRGPYDLVLTCSDVYVQSNIKKRTVVLVQEGITDPETFAFRLVKHLPFLPLWLAGTAATGLSDAYRTFCVASEGYRDLFIRKGARPGKIVVTGIPNFDDCERYRANTFPQRNYVLVCTSPLREVFRGEDRESFIRRAVEIAAGRHLVFKLHPNENVKRAIAEIGSLAPTAQVFTTGSAEEMIANCDVLVTRFSSTAFVGLALGKETYSDVDMDEMRRLMPVQNGCAAVNIAAVCRALLEESRA